MKNIEIVKKILIIIEQYEMYQFRMQKACSIFPSLFETLVLNQILNLNNSNPPTIEMILDLKDELQKITNNKCVNKVVNDAITHLTSKPIINKYQPERKELLYLNIFIQAEYQLQEKELFDTINTLKLYESLTIFVDDDDFLKYLKIERNHLLPF